MDGELHKMIKRAHKQGLINFQNAEHVFHTAKGRKYKFSHKELMEIINKFEHDDDFNKRLDSLLNDTGT